MKLINFEIDGYDWIAGLVVEDEFIGMVYGEISMEPAGVAMGCDCTCGYSASEIIGLAHQERLNME